MPELEALSRLSPTRHARQRGVIWGDVCLSVTTKCACVCVNPLSNGGLVSVGNLVLYFGTRQSMSLGANVKEKELVNGLLETNFINVSRVLSLKRRTYGQEFDVFDYVFDICI